MPLKRLVEKFKQYGHKMTPQRRAILEVLTEDTYHLTAEQIHEAVKKRMPDVSLATVYNTLHELAQMEEVCELDVGRGVRRYEVSQENHAHRVCLECGRIEDVSSDFKKVKPLFQCGEDFCPVRYVVTIYGYCAGCVCSSETEGRNRSG